MKNEFVKPYLSVDTYLKGKYGQKVYKIAVSAGMTCPNRDGLLDTRGCIFCSKGGSGEYAVSGSNIVDQLEEGRKLLQKKQVGSLFIAYFQAYTNTYAPVSRLRELFTQALEVPDIVGISIATRPDCLPPKVIELLGDLQLQFPQKFIWIELGLQTIHEETATYLRRGYSLGCFEDAVRQLNQLKIPIITHIIIGLPGETEADLMSTIDYLNPLPIFGIKLQLLHVIEDTDLAIDYRSGKFEVLTKEAYLELLIRCIKRLREDIVIHRVTGDGPRNTTIAPRWSLNKRAVLNELHRLMAERKDFQGKDYLCRTH